MHVLNVAVPPDLPARWAGWLAPERQPFFLKPGEAHGLGLAGVPLPPGGLVPELRDTFALWNVRPDASEVVWLTESEWRGLPASTRRRLVEAQVRNGRGAVERGRAFRDLLPGLGEGRFVWWPSLVTPAVLERVLSLDRPPCQRERVPPEVWEKAASLLPKARDLAGTFARASGPNCFGTVMGAAGVPGAEYEWMDRGPFEAFLRGRTRRVRQMDAPGTVLVWRDEQGAVQHAAVTLGRGLTGEGWALHKPSQSWMTPRVALPTRTLILASRTPGWRLERRALVE